MSDSEDSTVTYTTASSPYEGRSGDVSPGVDGPPEEHPASADSIPPPPTLRVTARISFRTQPPTLSFTKEDAERFLAMPIPPTITTYPAMIDQGVNAALAARDANQTGDDSDTSGTGVRRTERVTRECTYQDFMKCQPLY
nr:hypothetical protein [Tanacetum cinerariifolium]